LGKMPRAAAGTRRMKPIAHERVDLSRQRDASLFELNGEPQQFPRLRRFVAAVEARRDSGGVFGPPSRRNGRWTRANWL